MNTKLPIYLDYMATTPVDPEVLAVMVKYMTQEGCFGNPASKTHLYGLNALKAVEQARQTIALCIGASACDIIFTSGATESNNLALIGAARFHARKGKHLITLNTEHKAVLDSFHQLEKEGFEVTYLSPKADGLVELNDLKLSIRDDTILVSIMHVNNEIGVIQDIHSIGEYLKNRGILFHVDGAQSMGKVKLDLSVLPVDLMSFSAHKAYGPKGIGALFIRQKPRVRIEPLSYGGGHEGGLRSGTLATHQIVGMAKAFELCHQRFEDEIHRISDLRQALWQGIKDLPGLIVNGSLQSRVAHNLNVTFKGIEGSSLLYALKDLALSNTSACASQSNQPSYVLKALGRTDEEAYSSVRISLGRYTQKEDIQNAIEIINREILRLRMISVRS